MHQNGYTNTVAILGSELSDEQYKLLIGKCKQVFLMLDNDKNQSGQKASKKIAERLKNDFIVKVCSLPDGKDPNDCSKEEITESVVKAKFIWE
jgi:DNA primase